MAYDEQLAGRIRDITVRTPGMSEKKMFGGMAFLHCGNMCVGVWKNSLIVRLSVQEGEAALYEPHVSAFDVTGRPMKGWIMVDSEGVAEDKELATWIHRAIQFVITLPAKAPKS